MLWQDDLLKHFQGVVPVDQFLSTYLPRPRSDTDVTSAPSLAQSSTKSAASGNRANGFVEEALSSFLEYLTNIVVSFPEGTAPSFAEIRGHATHFSPIDPDDHEELPTIIATRPGQFIPAKLKNYSWRHAGTVIRKFKCDVFTNDAIDPEDAESLDALIQVAKSARSLLASPGRCFVFVVAVCGDQARVLRFDHASFKASGVFDWTENTHIFPTFFWRLYNPDPKVGDRQARILGEDYTISAPTPEEKRQMYDLWTKTPSYIQTPADKRLTFEAATAYSRWVQAVRTEDGTDIPALCFTIGPPLCESGGLFSRATRVDRVLIKNDPKSVPTVYALKDAWRETCHRPEVDFYDVIHRYCKENQQDSAGMACCHGTLDLSDDPHHRTDSGGNPLSERLHMRTLLTPVGLPLTTYPTTKRLVKGLQAAVRHHLIAYEAGVLHRDLSEGNILFDETTLEGFLVDFDCAEFTPRGLANFRKWFPDRAANPKEADYMPSDQSLRELTGTFPFLAIGILKTKPPPIHTAGHDLESLYWLMVWIILRYTRHPDRDSTACDKLFDDDAEIAAIQKSAHLNKRTLLDPEHPLCALTERLRLAVRRQNPLFSAPLDPSIAAIFFDGVDVQEPAPRPAIELRHEEVQRLFTIALTLPNWPPDDKAIPFVDRNSTSSTEESSRSLKARETRDAQHVDLLRSDTQDQDHGAINEDGLPAVKRKQHEMDGAESAPTSSASASTLGTSSASGSAEPASKKPKLAIRERRE